MWNWIATRAEAATPPPASSTNTKMGQDLFLSAGSYALTFWYQPRTNTPGDNGINYGFEDLGGMTIGAYNVSSTSGIQPGWSQITQSFNVSTDDTYRLFFEATGQENTLGGFIDNVAISAIPEPATWLMMVMGFGLVGAASRRPANRQSLWHKNQTYLYLYSFEKGGPAPPLFYIVGYLNCLPAGLASCARNKNTGCARHNACIFRNSQSTISIAEFDCFSEYTGGFYGHAKTLAHKTLVHKTLVHKTLVHKTLGDKDLDTLWASLTEAFRMRGFLPVPVACYHGY